MTEQLEEDRYVVTNHWGYKISEVLSRDEAVKMAASWNATVSNNSPHKYVIAKLSDFEKTPQGKPRNKPVTMTNPPFATQPIQQTLAGWYIILNDRGYQIGIVHSPRNRPNITSKVGDRVYRLQLMKETPNLEELSHKEDYILINRNRFQVGGRRTLKQAQETAQFYNDKCGDAPHVIYKLIDVTEEATDENEKALKEVKERPKVRQAYVIRNPEGYMSGRFYDLETAMAYTIIGKGCRLFKCVHVAVPGFPRVKLEEIKVERNDTAT